jgi:hypothetical protein
MNLKNSNLFTFYSAVIKAIMPINVIKVPWRFYEIHKHKSNSNCEFLCFFYGNKDRLVARIVEHQEIRHNLLESFNHNKSVSLYVNGPPG